jgi:ABC-type uncharacterized transport system involved in gliding motility auxiliary subunit
MKQKKILSGMGVMVAGILAVASIILVNTSITSWRLDLTDQKLFTLSEGTLNILQSLEEPITLTLYVSKQAFADVPQLASYTNRVQDLLYEYAAESGGQLRVEVIEPEPFSEVEDRAVAAGLQGIPITAAGDLAYFGLVGTNSVDNELIIPFFQNDREQKLEYDLTKLIYNLANPDRRVIGILTSLPVFGESVPGMPPARPWTFVQLVTDLFEIKIIDAALEINQELDLLLVIHPKELTELTQFAIDQYLLGGGKAMIFVDPLAEGDNPRPDPENPYEMPVLSSNLDKLFSAWGISVTGQDVAGDMGSAMRVQIRTDRGVEETDYLPWLKFDRSNLNVEDFATSELNSINMGTAGIIEKQADAAINFTPLIETTTESMKLPVALLQMQREPAQLLSDFRSANTRYTLAARIDGNAKSAFPEGRPAADTFNPFDEGYNSNNPVLDAGTINAIIVADTDILHDDFWISMQNFFGVPLPQAIADNGNFLVNALDMMSGSTDLISLRSRGEYSRPFEVVEEIRREAEAQFRQEQQMLLAKLEETEQKLATLQQERTGNDLLLSDEQRQEIEKFRQEQLNTRQQLRNVQHELQKNIERLGTVLKIINIGLIPLFIAIMAVTMGYVRTRRKDSTAR